jgi:hypothetical protein
VASSSPNGGSGLIPRRRFRDRCGDGGEGGTCGGEVPASLYDGMEFAFLFSSVEFFLEGLGDG